MYCKGEDGYVDSQGQYILRLNSIKLFLLMLYVDDARFFLAAIKLGMQYNSASESLEYCEDRERLDKEACLAPTEKTASVLSEIMNSIEPDLGLQQR